MHTLTTQLLEAFPYSVYADPKIIQRGKDYYKDRRVVDVRFHSEAKVECTVEGDGGEYSVEIEVDAKTGELAFACDCPYSLDYFCKHMIAAGLEVTAYLKAAETEDFDEGDEIFELEYEDIKEPPVIHLPAEMGTNWKNLLESAISQSGRAPRVATNMQRYAAVLLMAKEEYYYQTKFVFIPYVIKAKDWPPLARIQQEDAQAVQNFLDTNLDWYKAGETLHPQLNPAGCLNLGGEGFSLLSFFQQMARFYNGASFFIPYLPMLAQLHVPVYRLGTTRKKIDGRVAILPNPVDIQVIFTRENGNLVLKAGLNNLPGTPGDYTAELLSQKPPWVLMNDKIFPLRDANQLAAMSIFPISIPEKDAETFREHYLRRVAESLPVHSDLIHWEEVSADPVPRLYLHDDKDKILRADLRFGYGAYEADAMKNPPETIVELSTAEGAGPWDMLRIARQPECEQAMYQLLTDPDYRLKRAGASQPYGTFELRARSHPFDFLMYSIPKLTAAGFEIYGEEKLKLAKLNRSTPTLHVNITSGIDWFDLKATVEYGDQQVPLLDLRKALKRGEQYVKLADGSVGQIPPEWLEKYKHLWNLAEEKEDGSYRVNDFHLPLIDSLLEGDAVIQIPPDLPQRRERLRSFESIATQALPAGFTGELRPYQKHGLDWLHFLREYKFGGILADDMGLGKTVQVLVYLLSLREQSKSEGAALLVVPKSLIANWQRESQKFTPGLRFLEYVGNFRSKDTAIFNEYDVVLTTYGTMLRDIDVLRAYKFHHVILDESQAIKNPLAKSAKAACLLSAEHRLVMTGTPVENNTFELWSQFAFLNPGLLGSMESFKREFATPIESGQDEQAAATLRKLVYPFILRRTKDQVAPELPPRTERVLYTDMDAPQKKLYTQTRERYRAELLGLIESDGMNDARFKILEGLLRLRQIAIHPALVDKAYKGEAPKFDLLLETLETLRAEGHKALIFSQFVETLKLVRKELDMRKILYLYLDGRTRDRQSVVDQFQNDAAISFFLISLKAGGVGLNLTAADYVIHLDPWWNPAVEMQASDRAHRIGQDKPVFVYKLIARDTVEEKILLLQEKKRALVKNLIATEASFFKSLTKEDVSLLFD